MKLLDFNPEWITLAGARVGVRFECPGCRATQLRCLFTPLEQPSRDWPPEGKLIWSRTGDTFDALTLTPSLNFDSSGHWHGNITNGEMHTSGHPQCASAKAE